MSFLILIPIPKALGGVSKKVDGYLGEAVVLPCSITTKGDMFTLEWSRVGPPLEIAFVYRQGCETFEMKSPVFQFRTNLFMSQLNSGNMSLRVSELRLSDQGEYQCKIIEPGTKPKVVETVELFVGAASQPRLSVVPGEGDRMVLQCESNCWFPAPNVTFLDDQGKDLPARNPMRNQDSQGCFYVKRNVTLQTDTKRVTCRVRHPLRNQARYAEINIPAECTHSSSPPAWVVVVAVVACVISSGAMFVLGKKCSSCACMKKQSESKRSSDQGTAPRSTEGCTEGHPGSSADTSHPTNPSDGSPNNSPPTSHSTSPIRADPTVSGQNPASPVRGHHANGSSSSLVDSHGSASSSVSSVPASGEQNPPMLRRLSESRKRSGSTSFRLSRTYTMSRHPTVHEDSKLLMETEAEPDNEG
ncbi:hypothetical protein INR49_006826 [Caranx melampygus]|nr:hypothetical protein INR49_006826 [Caranx melampygus]